MEKIEINSQHSNGNMFMPDRTALLTLEQIQESVSADFAVTKTKNVLSDILDNLTPIDFQRIAGLKPDEKLTQKHTVVLTVREVLRVAKKLKCDLCRHANFIYTYNGEYWQLLQQEQLQKFLGEAAERLGVDHVTADYHGYKEQLLKQFITVANMQAPELSNENCLINLKNGTFEVCADGFTIRPFSSDDFLTYQLPFDYDETAKCPRWQGFLDEVLPDKSRQLILAEFFAYIFTNLKLEKTLLLLGTGANGKSVVFEVIKALIGEENISHYSLSSLKREYERAMLVNKLLNYASEISTRVESDIFKKLSSGEPCEARLPYGKPFTMGKYAKLAFNCNELPRDIEHTNAFFRRFLIIKFEVTIPEERRNPDLAKEIIATELSGIFNWVLDGLQRLLTQKRFTHCEAAQFAVEEYRRESDSVALFLEESNYCKTSDRSEATMLKDVYGYYKSFCQDYNFRPVQVQNFANRLRGLGFECPKTNKGILVFAVKLPEAIPIVDAATANSFAF